MKELEAAEGSKLIYPFRVGLCHPLYSIEPWQIAWASDQGKVPIPKAGESA